MARRIKAFIFFAGIVLIIGPRFGFTVRGLSSLSTGESTILGIVLIGVFGIWTMVDRSNAPAPRRVVPVTTDVPVEQEERM